MLTYKISYRPFRELFAASFPFINDLLHDLGIIGVKKEAVKLNSFLSEYKLSYRQQKQLLKRLQKIESDQNNVLENLKQLEQNNRDWIQQRRLTY